MNVKEKIENFESLTLIKEASFSAKSLGREKKELDDETILKVLNVDLSDYGESIHKFIKACKDLYDKDNTNYIMDKCFSA